MKIKLTAKHRDTLAELREQLAAIFEENSSHNTELTTATQRQEKLQREIVALESSDDDGEKTASALNTKREQLKITERKITHLHAAMQPTNARLDPALDALRQLSLCATEALRPAVQDYLLEIMAAIRPWCQNHDEARAAAYSMPALISLLRVHQFRFDNGGFTIPKAKDAIAHADAILSGELNWKFDPKITGPITAAEIRDDLIFKQPK